jgi:hypothetical protein
MISVTTTRTIISDVPRITLIDVNACHANIMECFMMLGVVNVHGYLRNKISM